MSRTRRIPQLIEVQERGPNVSRYRGLDREALEQRLVLTEDRIADSLPAEEKFQRDARSLENEATTKLYLDRVFHTGHGEPAAYTVECHGRTCKVDATQPLPEWEHDIQSMYPESGWFCSMSFSDEVYIELCKPDSMGLGLVLGINAAFEIAKETHACLSGSVPRGDLTLRVRMEQGAKLRSEIAGPLAVTPVGLCLRKVFDDILARTIIPPGVTALPDVPIELELPPPARNE